MAWITSVATLITVAIVLYFIVRAAIKGQVVGNPTVVEIVGALRDGREPMTFSGEIPLSDNEKQGLVFSYACWFSVDDWFYRQGEQRCLFSKGTADLKVQCPGVCLDGTSNTLLVTLDTYDQTETIQIPNLPAQKFIHLAIVVDQISVEIYIDGILRIHHSLRQLPRQNRGGVHISQQGGWAGEIGSLTYHRYALTPAEINGLMATPPYEDPNKKKKPLPPYLDTTWYVGRF